eukprot:GHVL01019429.1.p1 GENE.GHVL01019429.1~~GHVL01019429.1.p1  ORF type:complete len:119 (+),score=33.97 GHVL01019429.1:61-417(+)
MSGRSSRRMLELAAKNAPKNVSKIGRKSVMKMSNPTNVQNVQPPQQGQSIMRTVMDGFTSGIGFSLGMRMFDGLFGPRQMEVHHTTDQSTDQTPQSDSTSDSTDWGDTGGGGDYSGFF